MYNRSQLELWLKFCLRGIAYDQELNTPLSLERVRQSMERAEQYKLQLKKLESEEV